MKNESVFSEVLSRVGQSMQHISAQLREQLVGVLKLQLREAGPADLSLVIDLNTGVEGGSDKTPDVTVKLSSADLDRVLGGGLNPQIAMVSGRIKVEGKTSIAMYFFNLLERNRRDD